ncbi:MULTISPECIES: hypothetical protein [unclassified Kitasatospora]|uniref:hypothetical protein n=1 Tax=unclassified Kitasatospora TaxID=2633591 RepID=UPI0033CC9051
MSKAHVARNLVLIAVAAAGLAASAEPGPGGLGPAGVAVVLLAAGFTSALIIATDTLVELFSAAR